MVDERNDASVLGGPLSTGFLVTLYCLAVGGCSYPAYTDTRALTIFPGVGISNVVEVGMTLREIRRSTHDVVVRGSDARVDVPSLGATVSLNARDRVWDVIWDVYFGTNLSPYADSSPSIAIPSFRGHVAGGLSFATETGVAREAVIRAFGEPVQSMEGTASLHSLQPLLDKGVSVSLREGNFEQLFYPDLGITFQLFRGIVCALAVQHPRQQGAVPRGPLRNDPALIPVGREAREGTARQATDHGSE